MNEEAVMITIKRDSFFLIPDNRNFPFYYIIIALRINTMS